ncbi:SgcJ/EcaC family oxidoreductase [Pseudonocardia sp. CA-107938]|uniref:SgcJ/EcaC family oxidoreductase n=1 Tax=Pseudonocardia sp. CA-107938 TaxID=3240021 RepID=UPI003D8F4C5F
MDIPHVEETADHAADEEAIRAIVADTEKAFNTGDAELLVAHMAANVYAVGVTGAEVAGREEALAAGRAAFAGPLKGQRARYDVVGITFVRPDVALARKHARALDEHGELIDVGHAMTALYVLAKEDGRWWIVARQNTLVG